MRYPLLILCVLLGGCDAIRTTTDRVFGSSDVKPETAQVTAEPIPDETPPSSENQGWIGARKTTAVLGDPNTPGRWLKTPLVQTEINGRVVVPRTGAQAYVTLIPEQGPQGAGSRLSVEAMRALLIPFDELVELDVYSN